MLTLSAGNAVSGRRSAIAEPTNVWYVETQRVRQSDEPVEMVGAKA